MMKTTNGKPCRPLLCPFAGLIQRETIYANWDMLIGIYEQGKPQHWCNAVHLSGAALRFTGKRVFDIFTALG
ncbi:hypothetical protein ACK3YO_20265, partial [Aeromonas caviae]